MNNPKINYTQEDIKTLLKNQYITMLIERNHPRILKKVTIEAERLATEYLERKNVDN